jgi:deoxyhypusine synthase
MKDMKDVKNFVPKKQTIDELLKQLKQTSFNARSLGKAVDVLEEMIKDKNCTKFLGLSGALVPAGMQECIMEMIKNRWVDIIVSTGANITHDLAIALGGEEYIQCEPSEVDDKKMREQGISRIYDIISPDKTSIQFEKEIQKILKTIDEGSYSTYELMEKIGKAVNEGSITSLAASKGVKIIVPAFFDSILGMQVWMHTQERKIIVDERKDLDFLINLNYELKEQKKSTGAFILGGGVPKNFILQSVIIPDKPHKYAVQITTDTAVYGGLSGATLEESISWGKTNEKSKLCTVYCDVTIALPIIVSALKERL